jgi:hypothetical protein
MPSPFPGVDPYIEDQHFWQDFHQRFMTCWCDQLLQALPRQYDARLEETVRLVERSARRKRQDRQPDIAVEHRVDRPRRNSGGLAVARKPTLQPVQVELPILKEYRQTRIRILHRPERELITVLELLSPDNKRGSGFDAYIEKRSQLHWQDPKVHLVELDLLLKGHRLPMADPLPTGDFYAIVRRSEKRETADVFSWTVRDPLPVIPLPLRQPDADCLSDLAEVFRTTYERGCYEDNLDYQKPLKLPLAPAALRWAAKLTKSRKS